MEVCKSDMISCAIEWQPSEAAFDVWPLMTERASQGKRPYSVPAMPDDSGDDATNLKVKHWGSLNSTPLQYSMVLSWIPDSGKSGMAVGMDPRSPANRGWRWGWTPDPRQIMIGSGMGMIPDCGPVPSSCA